LEETICAQHDLRPADRLATYSDRKITMNDFLDKLSWDDLRVIKAIGESKSLALAAAKLGINTSAVSRRLDQVEETLGIVIFDRRRTGCGTES